MPLTTDEILALPFSIERHKQAQWLDFEAILSPDGEVFYAMPSHQEFLIKKVMDKYDWTRDELCDACPKEYYYDFMTWLAAKSDGYVPVWEQAVLDYPLTKKQVKVLRDLKIAGIYRGKIPKPGETVSPWHEIK